MIEDDAGEELGHLGHETDGTVVVNAAFVPFLKRNSVVLFFQDGVGDQLIL